MQNIAKGSNLVVITIVTDENSGEDLLSDGLYRENKLKINIY